MAEELHFPTILQAGVFLGAAYTGKTQSLLREMDNLLREGIDSSEILTFCASPAAAQSFSARLEALGSHAKTIEVTTPRAFFLGLLDTKEAFEATGRKARLLLPFEYDFFLEDLKTSGMQPKRLREMLKFFYRSITELADDDEEWLITFEEREQFGILEDCLSFTGAILEPELANLTIKYLTGSKDALEKARRTYVFVDDFQLLSRASQFALSMLAKECIYLSADKDVTTEVYESYPYLNGMDEFIQANPHAALTHLTTSYSCNSAAKANCALRQEIGINASDLEYSRAEEKTCLQIIEGKDPHDEMTGIVDAVEQVLNTGLSAQDVAIAAPHPVWMRNILRQLSARGIPAELLPDVHFLKSDIRSNEKCFNARFLTILSLIADPTDAVAWRCWCGFDDYLGNSSSMCSLRNFGKTQGKTLDSILETDDLRQEAFSGLDEVADAQRILRARDEAHTFIGRLGGLSGQDLLEAIAFELAGPDALVPEEIKSLLNCQDSRENMSAVSMVNRVRTRLEFPVYYDNDAVRIVFYKDIAGLTPRYLLLPGFMNGFFPKCDYFDGTVLTNEQREKRYSKDLSSLAIVVAKASDALVLSYCKKLDLEDAKRLDLVVGRIVFENNKRVAKTEPSIFLKFIDV